MITQQHIDYLYAHGWAVVPVAATHEIQDALFRGLYPPRGIADSIAHEAWAKALTTAWAYALTAAPAYAPPPRLHVESVHEFRVRLHHGKAMAMPEGWEKIKIEGNHLTFKADRNRRRVVIMPTLANGDWRLDACDKYDRAIKLLEGLDDA